MAALLLYLALCNGSFVTIFDTNGNFLLCVMAALLLYFALCNGSFVTIFGSV